MPTIQSTETDAEVNEDYPYIPVDGEVMDDLKSHISARIAIAKEISELDGQKKIEDGFIYDILNEYLYSNETPETLKNGYLAEGEDEEEVQLQVRNAYSDIKCAIKNKKGTYKETNKKILALAQVFELDVNEDGTFPFPEGTFKYKDTIKLDPSVVPEDRFQEFINDVKALGKKYSQGKLNPVSEETILKASPVFHRGRLKLTKKINLEIHKLYQNYAIKLINEEEE